LRIEWLCQRLTPGRDVKVFDVGCGAGVAALELVRRGFYVHGIDVSERMVALSRERFAVEGVPPDRYRFTCVDLLSGSVPPASFDGVVALGFLQYVPDELQALRILHGVLKPGGALIISGPNRSRISNHLGLSVFIETAKDRLRGGRTFFLLKRVKAALVRRPLAQAPPDQLQDISPHWYSAARFRTLLTTAGFEVLRHEGHGFVGFPLRKQLGFKGELFLHRSLTRMAAFTPIGHWANDIVVLAAKPE